MTAAESQSISSVPRAPSVRFGRALGAARAVVASHLGRHRRPPRLRGRGGRRADAGAGRHHRRLGLHPLRANPAGRGAADDLPGGGGDRRLPDRLGRALRPPLRADPRHLPPLDGGHHRAGRLALYGLCRDLGVSAGGARWGWRPISFNPLVFVLAFTFMTDAHFVALLVIATWLLCAGPALRPPSRRRSIP